MSDPLAPYDALLLVSYGGPEGPDDVLPFMRNATGGAGIPDERLLEVSGHYQRFGGISPINACNRALCDELNARFAALGSQVRIVLGNRNWHPYFTETLTELIDSGARRILTLFTTAYTSYSGCRQYRENLADALEDISRTRDISDVVIDRVRPFANTDGFIDANAKEIFDAWASLDDPDAHVTLVTHSIPLVMARASGAQPTMPAPSAPALFDSPRHAENVSCRCGRGRHAAPAVTGRVCHCEEQSDVAISRNDWEKRAGMPPQTDMSRRADGALSPAALNALLPETAEQDALGDGWGYLAQHLAVGAAIMEKVCAKAGRDIPFDLAFCSRSGPPQAQWLEPDINDHLEYLADRGVRSVVTAPIGFVSDHMEVVFDLDTEAKETASELGLNYRRAGTAGTSPVMIDQLMELILERVAQARGKNPVQAVARHTYPAWGENCGANCCQYPRPNHPHSHPHTDHAEAHSGVHGGAHAHSASSEHPHTQSSTTQTTKQGGTMAMPPQHRPFKPAPEITRDPRDWVVDPEEVIAQDNWAIHMVFKQAGDFGDVDAAALDAAVKATGVEIRGWYDVAGFRADADLMCWVLAHSPEECQAAYRAIVKFTNTSGQVAFTPVWSAMSRHVPAEFNRVHLAACFGGFAARKYLAVYPFVRSYDWYYLPEARRGAILREHGLNGREFNDVPVSTLSAFALNDWEWTVSLEADSLERVMAVLRRQREAEARLFVRVDTPFYTGVRMELSEWVALRK